MKVLQLYNQQRSVFGGEESVINAIRLVLERHGHNSSILMRSSRGIEKCRLNKITAAIGGAFNPFTYCTFRHQLQRERPHIVHVHNVYPLFSPSVLVACNREHIPVVLHVHSNILTCPNWNHLRNGEVCELCFGGKEYWCLFTNCRGSLPESAAYTIRSAIARIFNLFVNNVTLFVTVSHFLRDRLIKAGFPEKKIEVLPNAVLADDAQPVIPDIAGDYIGYSGRLSPEKGVDTLIAAARKCGLPVRIAGDGPERNRLMKITPPNVEFLGRLNTNDLRRFYQHSRFIVMPSRSFEGFCLSVAEAMMHGKPVIASRIGALPEVVQDGLNGLLVEVDNVAQLASSMVKLWQDREQGEKYGAAAKKWAQEACCEEVYYGRLMSIYQRATQLVAEKMHGFALSEAEVSKGERGTVP